MTCIQNDNLPVAAADEGIAPSKQRYRVALSPKRIFERCVWLSSERTTTKLLLLCIGRYFDDKARSSSMSYQQISRECGFDESTAKRIIKCFTDEFNATGRWRWLEVEVSKGYYVTGRGAQNRYHGVAPPEFVEKVRAEMSRSRDATSHASPGWHNATPVDGRGGTGSDSGSHETTRTGDDSDEEKEKRALTHVDSHLAEETLEKCGTELSTLEAADLSGATRRMHTPSAEDTYARLASKWLPEVGTSFDPAEAWRSQAASLLKSYSPNIVDAAFLEAVPLVASRTLNSLGGFVSYFAVTWRSCCERLLDQQESREIERRTKARIAEDNVETEGKIGARRLAAFDRASELSQAQRERTTVADRARCKGHDDRTERFDPNAKLNITIEFCALTGAEGNMVLDEVPGATNIQARQAFVKTSAYLNSAKIKSKSRPVLADVIARAVVELAHIKHGSPEERFGKAATLYNVTLSWDWAVITAEKLTALQTAYRKALPADPCSGDYMDHEPAYQLRMIREELGKFAHARRLTYYDGLQEAVEREFERLIAEFGAQR